VANKIQIKSVLNAPQAKNDAYSALEDLVSYLNVLANDGGGNAAHLYALIGNGLTAAQINAALLNPVTTDYVTPPAKTPARSPTIPRRSITWPKGKR
jgi:hypothetical protein